VATAKEVVKNKEVVMKTLQEAATASPLSNAATTVPVGQRPPSKKELDENVDHAREQLLELRRKQEELERQKTELEELRRKQDEYERGKAEMTENITHALVVLEREGFEAQRRAALIEQTSKTLKNYLDEIAAIRDDTWTSTTVGAELTKALALIENTRMEYNRARTKLDCLDPQNNGEIAEVVAESKPDYMKFAMIGLAASAPLMIFATIWGIIFLVAK
jgi:DNA repair exonuclease SbcCD ATPase subunit